MYSTLKLTLIAVALFVSLGSKAQEAYRDMQVIALSNPSKSGRLEVNILYGSISIRGTESREVIIETVFNEKEKRDSSALGLNRISNDPMRFTVNEQNNVVTLTSTEGNPNLNYEIKVPREFSLDIKATNDGDIYVEGITGELVISNTNGAINMTGIRGSVIADALNNDITIKFDEVFEKTDMAFTSLNGNLDVTFPKNLNADVKAWSETGEVFIGFDQAFKRVPTPKEKKKLFIPSRSKQQNWITGSINDGGPQLLFKTINGNILIKSE